MSLEDNENTGPMENDPAYVAALGNHAIASGDESPLISGLSGSIAGAATGARVGATFGVGGALAGAAIGGVIGYDWRLAASAAVSGAAQTVNSISNILTAGSEDSVMDTGDVLANFDDDLSLYYKEHQEQADVLGFVAASVPLGMGGVAATNKAAAAFSAYSRGKLGNMAADVFGLFKDVKARNLQIAKTAIETTGVQLAMSDAVVLRAIAAGTAEQAITGLVFEGAVQASLNASPLLKDQDWTDIRNNMLHAALLGGAVGGAFEAWAVKNVLSDSLAIHDKLNMPFNWQEAAKAGTSPSDQYIINTSNKIRLNKETPTNPSQNQDAVRTMNRMDDDNRLIMGQFPSLKGNSDNVVQNLMHEHLAVDDSVVDKLMLGLVDVARPNVMTEAEGQVSALSMLKELTPEQAKLQNKYAVTYFHTWGEQMGNVTDTAYPFRTVWDELPANKTLKVTQEGVTVSPSKKYAHSLSESLDWNIKHRVNSHEDIANANAREMWARSVVLPARITVGEFDIPLLRRLASDTKIDWKHPVQVIREDGGIGTVTNAQDMKKLFDESLATARSELLKKQGKTLNNDAIASALGTTRNYILGDSGVIEEIDKFALDKAISDYSKRVEPIASKLADKDPANILLKPKQAKLIYDTEKVAEWETTQLPVITYVKQQQVVLDQTAKRAVASVLGKEHEQLIDPYDFNTQRANSLGAGSGMLNPADANMGTEASLWQRVGAVTHGLLGKARKSVAESFNEHEYTFTTKASEESIIELSTVMNKLRQYADSYYWSPEQKVLVHKGVYLAEEAAAAGKPIPAYSKLSADAPDYIDIKSDEVAKYLDYHNELNANRINKFNTIRSVFNKGDARDPRAVYFPAPDLERYPHVAIVSDPTVTSTGQKHMLYAASEAELEKQIALIPEEFKPGLLRKPKATTGPEWDRWHEAIGDYRASEVMDENYIRTALARNGTSSRYILQTDPNVIMRELKEWHLKEEAKVIREAVSLRYFKEFQEIRNLAEGEGTYLNSTVEGNALRKGDIGIFDNSSAKMYRDKIRGDNPYASYIRTALDLANTDKIPFKAYQDSLDRAVSKVWDTFAFSPAKHHTPESLDKLNDAMKAAGVNTITYDMYNIGLANHSLPKDALNTFTRRAGALIASVTLKPSALNAINNAVSTLIHLAPETQNIINAIRKGDTNVAGKLTALKELEAAGYVKVPGLGDKGKFLSTAKLIAQGIKDAHNPAIREEALRKGFSFTTMQDIAAISDETALTGTESVADLNSRISRMHDKVMKLTSTAEKWSGNKYAEEMTRAVSFAVIKKLTDVAVKNNILTEQVADAYIGTFVNRVNGIYQASQRPMMFNGPLGQAAGLFQTYMITFLNNALRHAKEGNLHSSALMLGMQGTIHGMSTLPGFQALNTYLVGEFASNNEHKDIYSAVYNTMDKDTADWFMFGALSNGLSLISPELKMNMYTRGDINPRHVSIMPINPMDYPVVNISGKFFGNLLTMLDDPTREGFLRALEHNGVSRELSGISQVIRGMIDPQHRVYATSQNNSMVGVNDLAHLSTLVRLAGAKPLEEAIVRDQAYRNTIYNAIDSKRKESLGAKIKGKIRDNFDSLTEQDIMEFQTGYIKAGGTQSGFNRYWTNLIMEATVPQAERLTRNLKSFEAQRVQSLLVGSQEDSASNIDQ